MDTTVSVNPGGGEVSPKSYATAVVLSSVFGFCGVQHLYLGRYGLFLFDLLLSFGWFVCFIVGEPILGVTLLIADFAHALMVTIQLLTGSFEDGRGRLVCYPGQKLGNEIRNHTMRTNER
jgi:TM2 domain-containing membrane protein YozV